MLLPKYRLRDSSQSRFIKKKIASWLLIYLGIKTHLCKIPPLGDILLEKKELVFFYEK